MKLDFDEDRSRYTVRRYGPGYIDIADQRISTQCLVTPDALVLDALPPAFALLGESHLARCLQLKPDVLLFGTGSRQHFPGDAVLRALVAAGVGYEFMDTPAACRSYNVLVADNRWVVAALFINAE